MEHVAKSLPNRVATFATLTLTVSLLALGGCTVNASEPRSPPPQVINQPAPVVVQPQPNVTMVPSGSVVVAPTRTY